MFRLLRSASECQWTWSKGRKKAGKEKPEEKCARRKVSANCSACAACVGKGLQSHAHWQGRAFSAQGKYNVSSFSDF